MRRATDSARQASFRSVPADPAAALGIEVGFIAVPGAAPRWSSDGKEIYLLDRAVHSVPVDWTGGTLHAVAPRKLFDVPDAIAMDVTPDGQRFLMQRSAAAVGPAPSLVLIQNWPALLKR